MSEEKWKRVLEGSEEAELAQKQVDDYYGKKHYSSAYPKAHGDYKYIDENGAEVEIGGFQHGHATGRLYVSGEGEDLEFSTLTTGTKVTEKSFSGTIFNDAFVTGENLKSLQGGYGKDYATKMSVNGNDGEDVLILPGKLSDYHVSLAEIPNIPGNQKNPEGVIVLYPKDPQEDRLERIVISNVENIVFTGDVDALEKLKELSEKRYQEMEDAARKEPGFDENRFYVENRTLPNPEDVKKLIEDFSAEKTTLVDLRAQVLKGLDPDQRAAYKFAASPEAREAFDERWAVMRRLNALHKSHMKDPDDAAKKELFEKEFRIATGQEEGTISILGKGVSLDPPLLKEEQEAVMKGKSLSQEDLWMVADNVVAHVYPGWEDMKFEPTQGAKPDEQASPQSPDMTEPDGDVLPEKRSLETEVSGTFTP